MTPDLPSLLVREHAAIMARMQAEIKYALDAMRASPPDDAQVYLWPTYPCQIGLQVPYTGETHYELSIGTPYSNGHPNIQMEAALRRALSQNARSSTLSACYIGDKSRCVGRGDGLLLLLRGPSSMMFMDDYEPYGGLDAQAFFDAFALGEHWRRAVRADVARECTGAMAQVKQEADNLRERVAKIQRRNCQVQANLDASTDAMFKIGGLT